MDVGVCTDTVDTENLTCTKIKLTILESTIGHTFCDGLFALSAGFVFTKRIIFLANPIGCTISRISVQESSEYFTIKKISKIYKTNKNLQLDRNAYLPNFHRTPMEFVVSHSNIHSNLPQNSLRFILSLHVL